MLTRRGKWIAASVTALVVVAGALGLLLAFDKAPAPIRQAAEALGIVDEPPPPCPLTGKRAPGDVVPNRPALAVKIENIPESRPQMGLQTADVVYEEPVEGGITRFVAVYQCRDAGRVGPVRSGRETDPDILVQFGKPIIGYSGGANLVRKAIEDAGLIDVNVGDVPDAYERDPDRVAPHDLFTATEALYAAAKSEDGPPEPVFTYDEKRPGKSRRAASIHLPFSTWSDVNWTWNAKSKRYLRAHGTEPHLLENGAQVAATNVVVMMVKIQPGQVVDANGVRSPNVRVTGSGRAYVFRDGRMILGKWRRPSLEGITVFTTKSGDEIPLRPGVTWVELLPSDIQVETG